MFPNKNLNKEKEWMGDTRNALLVVAALIASMTYQAVLQPPSFAIKDDRTFFRKGFVASYESWMTGPPGRTIAFIAFMSGNTLGLLLSIQMIICLTRDLPVRLPLLLSVTATVQTYYCLTYYLLFTLLDKALGLKNVELLSALLLMTSILLLLIQRRADNVPPQTDPRLLEAAQRRNGDELNDLIRSNTLILEKTALPSSRAHAVAHLLCRRPFGAPQVSAEGCREVSNDREP
ncbi:hypothetical protein NL676_009360 [Syzygium grande]|nr:hypothetical protein NL676_009360 [Syzygium grande]